MMVLCLLQRNINNKRYLHLQQQLNKTEGHEPLKIQRHRSIPGFERRCKAQKRMVSFTLMGAVLEIPLSARLVWWFVKGEMQMGA